MSKSGLGKAIKNRIEKKQRIAIGSKNPIFYQETEQNDAEIKKQKMKSVIQQTSLNDFLQTAELSQQNFKANRDIKFREIREEVKNRKVIMINDKAVIIEDDIDQKYLKGLQVPRRPDWRQIKGKEQLERLQSQTYLNWRRTLANLEETNAEIHITPYQKNLQIWRQLWRVTERADLMIQIVDGRDPLFFRSQDLVDYVKQISPHKKSLLLINKSDLVPQEVRERWNKYFLEHGINHIFFSAKLADTEEEQNGDGQSQQTLEESEVNLEQQIMDQYFNKPKILSTVELSSILNYYSIIFEKPKIEVGLVGYPNVGKSSVINSLFGKKKVGVASMPGKTKHFQTLLYSERVTLVDCPGLVFPRISASHSYMILNGLYSIDTLKAYDQPMKILVDRIHYKKFEQVYGLHWKQNELYDFETVLNKYSTLKGFFTGNGTPNQAVAARNILKDYVNGVLAYARNPPGLVGQQVNKQDGVDGKKQQTTIQVKQEQMNMKKKQRNLQNQLDDQFFKEEKVKVVSNEEFIEMMTEDDLLDIIEGKKIPGLKVTKQMRKNIKFAMKRGEGLDKIKKTYFGHIDKHDPKNLIKN